MGRVQCRVRQVDDVNANTNDLQRLQAAHPSFLPAIFTRINMNYGNGPAWDQVLEAAHQLNSIYASTLSTAVTAMSMQPSKTSSEHVEAVKALFLFHCCKEGQMAQAQTSLKSVAMVYWNVRLWTCAHYITFFGTRSLYNLFSARADPAEHRAEQFFCAL